MTVPTDFYTDGNKQKFYVISSLCSVPDFVKNAHVEQPAEINELPTHLFADPLTRRFPCHTKAATWLAQAYFQLHKEAYDKKKASAIQARIDKMAEYFQTHGAVNLLKHEWTKAANAGTPELQDRDYALLVNHDGQLQRLFPIPTIAAVKTAGEYLYANRTKYPYVWRKTAARNILARAAEHEIQFTYEAGRYLEKAAGYGATVPLKAAELVGRRALALQAKSSPYAVKMAQIAKHTGNLRQKDCTPQYLQKIAEVVDSIDRESGLYAQYNHGMRLPEEDLFAILEKDAEEVIDHHVVLTTGKTYPLHALASLSLDKMAEVMGPEFVSEVQDLTGAVDPVKVAELARTLPRNDALLFERLLDDSKIEKQARVLKNNPYSTEADPFSKESLLKFFKDRGHNAQEMNTSTKVTLRR